MTSPHSRRVASRNIEAIFAIPHYLRVSEVARPTTSPDSFTSSTRRSMTSCIVSGEYSTQSLPTVGSKPRDHDVSGAALAERDGAQFDWDFETCPT